MNTDDTFMRQAVELARPTIGESSGRPFGALVVQDGRVLGRGHNTVLLSCDPTAHAEVNAIRDACRQLTCHRLAGAILYSTAEPCPMCLAAAYWAGIADIRFGMTSVDASAYGFGDEWLYAELASSRADRRVAASMCGQDAVLQLFLEYRAAHPAHRSSVFGEAQAASDTRPPQEH